MTSHKRNTEKNNKTYTFESEQNIPVKMYNTLNEQNLAMYVYVWYILQNIQPLTYSLTLQQQYGNCSQQKRDGNLREKCNRLFPEFKILSWSNF